jgi:hypothetical protein
LKGSGSLFSRRRLIERWTGRNNNRNTPARAITNFLEMDENKILFIGYEIITGFIYKGTDLKLRII